MYNFILVTLYNFVFLVCRCLAHGLPIPDFYEFNYSNLRNGFSIGFLIISPPEIRMNVWWRKLYFILFFIGPIIEEYVRVVICSSFNNDNLLVLFYAIIFGIVHCYIFKIKTMLFTAICLNCTIINNLFGFWWAVYFHLMVNILECFRVSLNFNICDLKKYLY